MKLSNSISQDVKDFLNLFDAAEYPKPGLYTFPYTRSDGRRMRLHLRIEPGGAGVLFVDVTDVIHLNPMAAEISKLVLDGISRKGVLGHILTKYGNSAVSQAEGDIEFIFNIVEHFLNHDGGCYTCALTPIVDTAPLFSVPVNAPYKVDIALTYGCNNECPHCYNETGRLGMPSLPLDQWQMVLDRVAQLGVPHVILTGGEATLHPDLPEIIRYADGLGMIVGLNTNGRHIAHSHYMQKLETAGLNHVQVTLASSRPEVHNTIMGAVSYDQTIRGIENALETGVYVITNTTLMRANMDHVEEIIDFIFDLGIRTFAMNGMIYSGGGFAHPDAISEEEMPPLLIRVRDHAAKLGMKFLWYTPTEYCRLSPIELEIGAKRCNAGEYSMCIEPNGDVLPCQSYYVTGGNILHQPWETIWDGELFRSFRHREADPRWAKLPEKCWECPDLPLCGGGCRIEREARDGVRVAEASGGGCSGCSGYCGTGAASSAVTNQNHMTGTVPAGSYIPYPNQIRTKHRSSGNMGLISFDEIQGE